MHSHDSFLFRRLPACAILALSLGGCGGNPEPQAQASAGMAGSSRASVPDRSELILQHVYVAYFGRPAEYAGVTYWSRELKQTGAPGDPAALPIWYNDNRGVRAIVDAFASSTEAQQLYSGATAQFVDGVYRNLFNRSADLAGLAYWTDAIDKGLVTRSAAALTIMFGAQGEDAISVRNKIAVAGAFYRLVTERTGYVLAYTGKRSNEIARRMLAMVDAKTDLVAFEPIIRATVEEIARESVFVTPAGQA
jgi:hypothetical protein